MILTIGHGERAMSEFLAQLAQEGARTLVDLRSVPVAPRAPRFNRDSLAERLAGEGIVYRFAGRELGERPRDPSHYDKGNANSQAMVAAPWFKDGLDQIEIEAARDGLVLLGAPEDPLCCHRFLLVGRALAARGLTLGHMRADGTIQSQHEVEQRLLRETGLAEPDLFRGAAAIVDEAYARMAAGALFRLVDRWNGKGRAIAARPSR